MNITIGNLPVEIRIRYHLPPEPSPGLYGPSSAPEVEWEGPDWLHAVAEHFNLWSAIDKMVLEGIEGEEE